MLFIYFHGKGEYVFSSFCLLVILWQPREESHIFMQFIYLLWKPIFLITFFHMNELILTNPKQCPHSSVASVEGQENNACNNWTVWNIGEYWYNIIFDCITVSYVEYVMYFPHHNSGNMCVTLVICLIGHIIN